MIHCSVVFYLTWPKFLNFWVLHVVCVFCMSLSIILVQSCSQEHLTDSWRNPLVCSFIFCTVYVFRHCMLCYKGDKSAGLVIKARRGGIWRLAAPPRRSPWYKALRQEASAFLPQHVVLLSASAISYLLQLFCFLESCHNCLLYAAAVCFFERCHGCSPFTNLAALPHIHCS